MKTFVVAISIVAMLGTAFATLTAVTFCLGRGANAKPPEIRALKLWMLGLTLLGLAGWAAGDSFAPTVVMGLILAIALLE